MKPVIFFRKNLVKDEEILAAKQAGFEVSFSRMPLKDNLVIARYSALPNYKELQEDLKYNNSFLINSHLEHNYIASFEYYYDIIEGIELAQKIAKKVSDRVNFFTADIAKMKDGNWIVVELPVNK